MGSIIFEMIGLAKELTGVDSVLMVANFPIVDIIFDSHLRLTKRVDLMALKVKIVIDHSVGGHFRIQR